MHWGREFVEQNMVRIDDADAIPVHEPYSSIWRLCHMWAIAAIDPNASYSVGVIEGRNFHDMSRIIDPRIPLRTFNLDEAARHVHPDVMIVVLDRPMDLVAGEAVLTGE